MNNKASQGYGPKAKKKYNRPYNCPRFMPRGSCLVVRHSEKSQIESGCLEEIKEIKELKKVVI